MPIYSLPQCQLPQSIVERLDREAAKHWSLFYQRHQKRFFSDRHYLDKEFPELAAGGRPLTVLEAGCGVGNAVLPLLEANDAAFAYACDFSATAVALLRAHPLAADGRVRAFVADLTCDDLREHVPAASVDFVMLIFVLSAIDPAKMPQVIRNVARTCKRGSGRVLLRDYARGDLAQARLAAAPGGRKKLSDDFYVRGDGTRAYYSSPRVLVDLFAAEGFRCDNVRVQERCIQNRLLGLDMDRRWIQAVFTYTGAAAAHEHLSLNHTEPAAVEGCRGDSGAAAADVPAESEQQEWEAAGDGSEPWAGLAPPFVGDPAGEAEDDMVEERVDLPGFARPLSVRSVSRTRRHTLAHTGLMAWESAPVLARTLLRHPSLLAGKRVLEVGCGLSPLVALAALRHCRLVAATDGSPKALALLEANIGRNASLVVVERLRLRQLRWSHEADCAALEGDLGSFDVVLGADVVYVESAVPQLFSSVARLLQRSAEARVVLCHITRSVSEERILSMAAAAGLASASEEALALPEQGPFRLLCFAWRDL